MTTRAAPATTDAPASAGPAPVVIADTRWIGPHGIGRFAREVLARIPGVVGLEAGGGPADPGDPWRTSRALARMLARGVAGDGGRHVVYFTPGFNPPVSCPVPLVMTLHDLIHTEAPGIKGAFRRTYYERIVRPAARSAARLLTVSEASRAAIAAWAGMHPDRVVNVGNGVDDRFTPDGTRHDPGHRYLLYVGARKAHKNIGGLLRALAEARRLHGAPDGPRLLMTGPADEPLARTLRELGVADAVTTLGELRDGELPALYRGAVALVIPSHREGFGLPALEAMACGTPVIASGDPALTEVTRDAALRVDAADPSSIARAMLDAWRSEPALGTRVEAGLAIAREYTWEGVAARVAGVIGAVAGTAAPGVTPTPPARPRPESRVPAAPARPPAS